MKPTFQSKLLPFIRWWSSIAWIFLVSSGMGLAQTVPVRLDDWVQMPASGDLTLTGTSLTSNPSYVTRINFMREEPGNLSRMWLCDLNGNLYIFNKTGNYATRTAQLLAQAQANETTSTGGVYLDFNRSSLAAGTNAEKLNVPNNPVGFVTGTHRAASVTGLFQNFTKQQGFANGLICVQFDPGYLQNGKFYTIHIEMVTSNGDATRLPNASKFPGFDTTGYSPTNLNTEGPGPATRQAVLIEWTDTNIANTTFEGTARELLRISHTSQIHPMGDIIFHPLATDPSHPEYGMMYVAIGDGGSGESSGNDDGVSGVTSGDRHFIPQRLDLLQGKVIRIIPNLSLHTGTSTVSANGRYRIPNSNPFVTGFPNARPEIWSLGHRNPHRFSWDPVTNKLFVCEIGLHEWEEVNLIEPGKNYGYADREGPLQLVIPGGDTAPLPNPDTLPIRLGGTASPETVTPIYPVTAYQHDSSHGDAISSGFVYRGTRMPQLRGKFVFGDITTGRVWYCDLNAMLAAHDGIPGTLATIQTIELQWNSPYDSPDLGFQSYDRMFPIVEDAYHARGGTDGNLPGGANISGNGRADIRLAMDATGELYLLSKSDGMVRALSAVPSLPVILTQPTSKTVTVGQSAEFATLAGGSPDSTYQWQRKAVGAPMFSNLTANATYSGVTSPTLTVNGATLAMAGDQFRCVATNTVGSTNTNEVTLTVYTAAKLLWLQTHFTPVQLNDPSISGDDADPERDGLINFLEYAFDFNPWQDSQSQLPQLQKTGSTLRLTYHRLRDELSYVAQACTGLPAWSSDGVNLEINGTEVTATYDAGVASQAFLRITVTPIP